MRLHYWATAEGNFGDDLNLWLWDFLLPGWRDWDPTVTLVGVGTILSAPQLDADGNQRYLVVGSGQGNGAPPDFSRNAWDIRAVRGPRSARALGLPAHAATIDPAAMIPDMEDFASPETSGGPVVVPHFSSLRRYDWKAICDALEISLVSPEDEARSVIARIAAAPLVLAESMHAAILADAFRVPWIAFSASPHFDHDKWGDWADSIDLDLRVHRLFPEIDRATRLLGKGGYRPTTHEGTGVQAPAAGPLPPLMPGTPPPPQVERDPKPHRKAPKTTMRLRYETLMIVSRLRRAMKATPQLSSDAALAAAKTRLQRQLDTVRQDYG